MANTIRLKRRAAGGAAGAPTTLATTEVAYNEQDDTLYLGYGDNGSGVATSVRALAGAGAFLALAGAQTVAGAKTFSTVPQITGTIAAADSSTNAATTAWVKSQGYLTTNQTITVTGDATGSGGTAIALTLATVNANVGTYTKVTVDGKGRVTAATTLAATDIPALTVSKLTDFDTAVRSYRLDQFTAPTAAVPMGGQRLTGLGTPTTATDAATKGYVDGIVQGLSWKQPVRVSSQGNVPVSNPGVTAIDGVTLNTGDRVLLRAQTTASENGIYVWNGSAAAMTRAVDADNAAELAGAAVLVEEGTNAGQQFVQASDTLTLGTSNVVFTQVGSTAGAVTSVTNSGTGVALGQSVSGSTLSLRTLTYTAGGAGALGITLTQNANDVGHALSGVANYTQGGTGADLTSLTTGALLKKGASALTSAVDGTDYLSPNATIVGGTF